MEVRLKEKIPGVFWPVHQAIRRGEVTEVVAKGGRGSGKSSYLSMELVWQLLRHPDCHAVVLRKVGGTLRNSVYNQIVWAIGELGCAGYFRCTVSPMECTYLPTGQKILFFGTDDPGKLKSLKLPFGAVGICWFEELDQFDGPEEVRNVEQTVLRGGSWTLTLKSFNPPAMARSWANRYALDTRPGKLVHHSTYRDLPRAMLGERFWADAEHLQRTNPAAFRHEYGGEVVGSGAAVFANLQLRAVPDDELERYDRVYYGVDWGWYPDPWAYNAAAYDAARRVLVIFDELTRNRTPNRETAELLLARRAAHETDRRTNDRPIDRAHAFSQTPIPRIIPAGTSYDTGGDRRPARRRHRSGVAQNQPLHRRDHRRIHCLRPGGGRAERAAGRRPARLHRLRPRLLRIPRHRR